MSATIAAVLLAAGSSNRFGTPKQLARWRGETLVRRAARLLLDTSLGSSTAPIVAVVGHRAAGVEDEIRDLAIEIVHNSRHAEGQSTSVAAGVRAVRGRCRGALFLPCDQPLLKPETLDKLVHAAGEKPSSIIRPIYGERPGAPVLFPAELFDELEALRGDEGGRQLMRRYPRRLHDIEIPDEAEGLDVDRISDLEELEALANERSG